MRVCTSDYRRHARGFTFVIVLALIALMSIGAASVGSHWSYLARREREAEILRVGDAYARAIFHYYRVAPGGKRSLPPTLQSLVADRRGTEVVRHIRKLYGDPAGAGRKWEPIVDPEGKVRGVYFASDEEPLYRGAQNIGMVRLLPAKRYQDWQFIPKLDP